MCLLSLWQLYGVMFSLSLYVSLSRSRSLFLSFLELTRAVSPILVTGYATSNFRPVPGCTFLGQRETVYISCDMALCCDTKQTRAFQNANSVALRGSISMLFRRSFPGGRPRLHSDHDAMRTGKAPDKCLRLGSTMITWQ